MQTDFEGKTFCKEKPGAKFDTCKIIFFMAYNSGANLTPLYVRGKVLSPEVWGKNSHQNHITHASPPLQKSNGLLLTGFTTSLRSFRATFLDPFSPPSSLSLSLELGWKSRMDVLSPVCYRCYDHGTL